MAFPQQCANQSSYVVKKTFIDFVDANTTGGEATGFRRVSSDPAIYDDYGKIFLGRSNGIEGEPLEYELTGLDGLSECGSDAEHTSSLVICQHKDNEGRPCGAVTCSTCSTSSSHCEGETKEELNSEHVLELFKKSPVYLRSREPSPYSSPNMRAADQPLDVEPLSLDLDAPAYIPSLGSSPIGSPRAEQADQDAATKNLMSEHSRLAIENSLLRENMRLTMENRSLSTAAESTRLPHADSVKQAVPMMMPVDLGGAAMPHIMWAPMGQLVGGASLPSNATPMMRGVDMQADTRTTVMWRNLPNNYTRTMLLRLLDEAGFSGFYDFVYLPIDFKTRACLGYAFINLVSPSFVPAFWRTFDGYSKWAIPSKKRSYVSWSDPHQGFADNVDRYRNSPVMHDSVPDDYKPVVFANGVRTDFPLATKKARAPRVRQSKSGK